MKYDYREAMKLSNQLCFPLYAASRNVIGQYTPYLNELGLTYPQYPVFVVLWETETGQRYGISASEKTSEGRLYPESQK